MAHLSISLLGTFDVSLDGAPITCFESVKVRALLAYLAVESQHPHWREVLAGLLWPEQAETRARHCLSQALYSLRHTLGDHSANPGFLTVSSDTRFAAAFCKRNWVRSPAP